MDDLYAIWQKCSLFKFNGALCSIIERNFFLELNGANSPSVSDVLLNKLVDSAVPVKSFERYHKAEGHVLSAFVIVSLVLLDGYAPKTHVCK